MVKYYHRVKKEKEKNVMACRELMRSQKQDFDICVVSY